MSGIIDDNQTFWQIYDDDYFEEVFYSYPFDTYSAGQNAYKEFGRFIWNAAKKHYGGNNE